MNSRLQQAIDLMEAFADRTGLSSGRPPHRYLWTDAFAVCNFLELARLTDETRYLDLALQLVDQVHRVLGRFAEEDSRQGWISGLDEDQGEHHPTAGGLRIGKPLPERGPHEPYDERREWDRDGQYFHYLTRWMHALDQVSRTTHDPRYHRWACELAITATRAFVYQPPDQPRPRMFWKMSIDLGRPLVASMGQHDSLDGFVTLRQLMASARLHPELADSVCELEESIAIYRRMLDPDHLATTDALGIGGLVADATRLYQILPDTIPDEDASLLQGMLEGALAGLPYCLGSGQFEADDEYRLGFRELGLAIGLHGAVDLWEWERARSRTHAELRDRIDRLARLAPVARRIERHWLDPVHRKARSWQEHRDINEVMLATALVPEGYLHLR